MVEMRPGAGLVPTGRRLARRTVRRCASGSPRRGAWARPLLLLWLGVLAGCSWSSQDEREQDQRMLRAERLARERARRARNERVRRRNEQWRARDVPVPRPAPPGPCEPAAELRRRVGGVAFDDHFAQAVRLVLAPVKADLVTLQGRPMQRFTFVVRMHPDEEPRFGRKRPRPLLELDLRFEPLCAGSGARSKQTLTVRLARDEPARRPGRLTNSLWPQTAGQKSPTVPVGRPIQLLLDPASGSARAAPAPHSNAPGAAGPSMGAARRRAASRLAAPPQPPAVRGVWQVTAARFPDRPRTRRLSLPSSKLTAALNVLHAVEVPCQKNPRRRCRFLTRLQGHRAVPTTLAELRRLAAPIESQGRVLHLHAALVALRYPHCAGDTRRVDSATARHPCAQWPAVATRPECLFWRAQHGYETPPAVHRMRGRWHVTRVISCPAQKLRVLRLDETYAPDGAHGLQVSDLTKDTRKIDAALRRLTSRRRRRR